MNECYLALKERYDPQQLYSNQMSKRYIALKKRYHTDLLVHFILIDPQILELLTSAQHYLPQIWSYYGMYNIIPYQIMKVSMLLCS